MRELRRWEMSSWKDRRGWRGVWGWRGGTWDSKKWESRQQDSGQGGAAGDQVGIG